MPTGHGLLLAALLFSLGVLGILARRTFIFVLMSLELMLNAAALAFVVAGARWSQPDGQVMFLLVLSFAAAEAAARAARSFVAAPFVSAVAVDSVKFEDTGFRPDEDTIAAATEIE